MRFVRRCLRLSDSGYCSSSRQSKRGRIKLFLAMMLASVTDKSYDQMTHDEILRVHGDAYLRMTPEQRLQAAAEAKERLLRCYAEQKELHSPRNKKLSEVTLGEIMDELGTVAVKFLIRIAFFVVGWFVVVWLAKYLGLIH